MEMCYSVTLYLTGIGEMSYKSNSISQKFQSGGRRPNYSIVYQQYNHKPNAPDNSIGKLDQTNQKNQKNEINQNLCDTLRLCSKKNV